MADRVGFYTVEQLGELTGAGLVVGVNFYTVEQLDRISRPAPPTD